jgi:hypothetical protein
LSDARHLVCALIEGKKADDCLFTRADGHAVKDFREYGECL